MACNALAASSLDGKLIKPKPLDLPVSRSIITLAAKEEEIVYFQVQLNNTQQKKPASGKNFRDAAYTNLSHGSFHHRVYSFTKN